MTDVPSDHELMAAVALGEEDAFTQLYERHKELVMRFAMRMLNGDKETALDVLQETFLYVFRKAPSYEPRAKLSTLLYKVVRSLSITAARKKKRGNPVSVDLDNRPDEGMNPGVLAEIRLDAARVRVVMDRMPDIHREVLILRLEFGLTYPEIADIAGVPVGTVKSRIHHALQNLKRMLGVREVPSKNPGEPNDGDVR